MMLSHRQLLKTAGLLLLIVFVVAGCQRQADSDPKADPSSKSKQVIVDVTGMS